MVRIQVPLVVFAAVIATMACSGDGADDSTSSTPAPTATVTLDTASPPGLTETTQGAPAVTTVSPTTATAPVATIVLPPYSIEARRTESGGDTVLVLVPEGFYTDLDLEDIMRDVVERFAPIATAHVVDSLDFDGDGRDDASASVLAIVEADAAVTPNEALFRADHYFVRLEEGFRMVFQGPFQSSPPVILGS